MKQIFENNSLPAFIYDVHTLMFLEVNAAAVSLYGYSKEEFLNLSVKDIRPAGEVSRFLNFISTVQTEVYRTTDVIHKKKDGATLYVEIFSHLIEYNNTEARMVLVNDVTDKKKAEQELKENQRKLSTLISNLQGMVYRCLNDKDWTMEFISEGCYELTGYHSEEIIWNKKLSYNSVIIPEDRTNVFVNVQKSVGKKEPFQISYRIRTASGELKWVGEKGRGIFNENGQLVALEGFIYDITETKKYQAELIEAKEKAEEMNRLKSVFLANMSHELRTPLIGILGYAEMLLNELRESNYTEMLGELLFSTNQLKDTIDSILDLSKIEAEHMNLKFQEIDIARLLPEAVKPFCSSSAAKGLLLTFSVDDEELLIKGDANVFNSIVKNLVNNAVKFTNNGGISVQLRKILFKGTWYAKLDVTDSGVGIPESAMKKIFEPFRQAHEGLARPFDGIGLGLTITKKFVHLLNGQIEVQSRYGAGSTFTVKFPLTNKIQKPDTGSSAAEAKCNPDKNQRPGILLVENDISTVGMMKMFLKENYDLDCALDGKTAVELAASKKYHVVLMDIALGAGINGVEAAKKITSLPGYTDIPLIAVTAYAMAGDKEYFLSQNFTHYLAKPFDKAAINNFLKEILTK